MADIDNTADIIDVRDIIARYEGLRGEINAVDDDGEVSPVDHHEDRDEYLLIGKLLGDLAGNGGDEMWEGDWYPITLIRDDYFEDYARELAQDIGAVTGEESWPANCIDWEKASHELQIDYDTVEYDGVTYWYR